MSLQKRQMALSRERSKSVNCSGVSDSLWPFSTVARQAPLSMGFPGQEYRNGLTFPSPGDLPDLGIKPVSPQLASRFFTIWGFPGGSAGKESSCNAGDPGSIPGLGRSPGKGYPLQYSWASLVAQMVKNLPAMRETWVRSLGLGRFPWRRERLLTPVF